MKKRNKLYTIDKNIEHSKKVKRKRVDIESDRYFRDNGWTKVSDGHWKKSVESLQINENKNTLGWEIPLAFATFIAMLIACLMF